MRCSDAPAAPDAPATADWIAVACEEHALRGRGAQPGFMQVCHGKQAPLARLRPGDRVVYYAPSRRMGVPDGLQSFVTLGLVRPGAAYRFDMGGGFVPWRRDVDYVAAQAAPVAPLRAALGWPARGWGAPLRFGLLRISAAQMHVIAQAMQAPLEMLRFS